MTFRNGNAFRDGLVHILSERCATCIFNRDEQSRFEPGTLKRIVDANIADDSALICHSTLYDVEKDEAVCRGFWDSYRNEVTPLRMAQFLGMAKEVEPPKG